MKPIKVALIIGAIVVVLFVLGRLAEILFFGLSYFGGFLLPLIPLIGLLWGLWFFLGMKGRKTKRRDAAKTKALNNLISHFGDTPEAQAAAIHETFDKRTGSISFHPVYYGNGLGQLIDCEIERSLATMPPQEAAALRSALLLRVAGHHVSDNNTWGQVLAIVYADGRGTIFEGWRYTWPGWSTSNIKDGVDWLVGRDGLGASVSLAMVEFSRAVKQYPDNPILQPLANRLFGGGSDLKPPSILAKAEPGSLPGDFLILGGDPKDENALYGFTGEGSLITIAPSRSGKSQCHVIPNLLNWDGPAVVLDVKNELFEKTSGWRAANVGPVIKFSPLTPKGTHRYNPITEVSDDPDHIWEDARFLADMLIVPGGGKEPFWENKARDILTAAIAYVVYLNPPNERGMDKVLDVIHGVGWERFLAGLATADIPTMNRAAKSLGEMQAQMRDSVLQTALASLSAWEGARMTRATAVSDWRPADLRSGTNPTIYICLRPNEVDSYISVLRVLIAQHIRKLTGDLPQGKPKTILFLLDELPRLRHMPPVEEALEIGAQYGIKLWMFAQTMTQLEEAYKKNADGMAGGCAVRCFMNPGMQDGIAQKLSDQIGFRESLVDGSRVKIAEPTVLAGPDFKDRVIVMATGAVPGTVEKRPAHLNDTLATRMAIPPAVVDQEPARG